MQTPSIIWLEKTGSTSDDLKKISNCCASFTVISAGEQTGGRGQGDHLWLSSPGENLTFSIFIRYDREHSLPAKNQQLLTMASSVAVTGFLSGYGISAQIKRPNDIYVQGRKICGMLIENSIRGALTRWSIIGIGINVNQGIFPPELPNPVSMCQLSGRQYDTKKCLREFLGHFSIHFDAIWTDRQAVVSDYERLLLQQ